MLHWYLAASHKMLSHDHPDARLRHFDVLAYEMYRRFGAPRPLEDRII